jgi:hypothetical protein
VQDEAAAALCDYLQGALIGAASTKRAWQSGAVLREPPESCTGSTNCFEQRG